MADVSDSRDQRQDQAYRVEVRRPLHRQNPAGRLVRRLQERRERRQVARREREARGEKARWWEMFDPPFGDLDDLAFVVLLFAAVALLVLAVVFAGPFLWILILFLVDLLLWILLALVGLGAWLLLGRPWQVVVLDHDGATVASAPVRGRRRAREHAAEVRDRLAAGLSPSAALMTV